MAYLKVLPWLPYYCKVTTAGGSLCSALRSGKKGGEDWTEEFVKVGAILYYNLFIDLGCHGDWGRLDGE